MIKTKKDAPKLTSRNAKIWRALRDESSGKVLRGKIAVNRTLLASISFALIISVSPSSGQHRIDGDALPHSHGSIIDGLKLAQLPGYSASGAHQCGSDKGHSCVVTGSGYSTCNDALVVLRTRDCCSTTPAGGTSNGFTLNCIPDRPR